MTQRKKYKTLFFSYGAARQLAQSSIERYLPGLRVALGEHFANLSPISVRDLFESDFQGYNQRALRSLTSEPAENNSVGITGMQDLPDTNEGWSSALIESMTNDSVRQFEQLARHKLEIAIFELVGEISSWAPYRNIVQSGKRMRVETESIRAAAELTVIVRRLFEQTFLRPGVERLHGSEFWNDTVTPDAATGVPLDSDLTATARLDRFSIAYMAGQPRSSGHGNRNFG